MFSRALRADHSAASSVPRMPATAVRKIGRFGSTALWITPIKSSGVGFPDTAASVSVNKRHQVRPRPRREQEGLRVVADESGVVEELA